MLFLPDSRGKENPKCLTGKGDCGQKAAASAVVLTCARARVLILTMLIMLIISDAQRVLFSKIPELLALNESFRRVRGGAIFQQILFPDDPLCPLEHNCPQFLKAKIRVGADDHTPDRMNKNANSLADASSDGKFDHLMAKFYPIKLLLPIDGYSPSDSFEIRSNSSLSLW